MKRSFGAGLFVGLVLLLAGCALLVERMGFFTINWAYMWPLFLVGLGLCFHIGGWIGGRHAAGLFMPGAILLVYGALFLFNVMAGWRVMSSYWPLFLLGPALGFFEMFLFGGVSRDVLIPAAILTVVGGAFLIVNLVPDGYMYFLPVLFIAIGLIVIISVAMGASRGSRRGFDSSAPPPGWQTSSTGPAAPPTPDSPKQAESAKSVFDRADDPQAQPPWVQPQQEPSVTIPPPPETTPQSQPVIPPPPWEKV